jgi:hypothetical protein
MRIQSLFLIWLGILVAAAIPSASLAYWCWDADFVYAEVDGGTITVHHEAAYYNCCPWPVEYEIDVAAGLISVQEIAHAACWCMCCFDYSVEIEDVPAGMYLLNFSWFDEESNEWTVWSLGVNVPAAGQVGHSMSTGPNRSPRSPAGNRT